MVVKRDFDKILVNLLRNSADIVNIALVDAEGMPISFVAKSKRYQIKPATLGSKAKILLFLAKSFATSNEIQLPIIQSFFFKNHSLIIINLKVVSFFILLDLKGWPPEGKLFYQNIVKVKELLIQLEETQDDALKSILEGEKKQKVKIADVSDNYIKSIAKNLNSLDQIQLSPISIDKNALKLVKNDVNSLSQYLTQNFSSQKITKAISTDENGTEMFKTQGAGFEFSAGIQSLMKNSFKELDTFDLGEPIWILNVFEKSELLIMNKYGSFSSGEIFNGILLENRVGNLKEVMNLLYKTASEINSVQNDLYLGSLLDNLEFLGLSASNLNIKAEKDLIKGNKEDAMSLLERAANKLQSSGSNSEAGSYYSRIGDILAKDGKLDKAESLYQEAASLHLKENNYEAAGEEFFKIGKAAVANGEISLVFENYDKALSHFKKAGNTEKIKTINSEILKVKGILAKQLKEFIDSSTGESIPFSYLQEKFNMEEDGLISVFKTLFEKNEIPGQINLIKKRYTKKRYGSDEAIVGETPISDLYKLPDIKVDILNQNMSRIDRELQGFEDQFEKINFPFAQYLDYEDKLHKYNFYEQKLKIYKSNLESNKCILCFKAFNKNDRVVDCGNTHFFHFNCAKVWLENQKICPICETNMLETLKTMYFEHIKAKDDLLTLQELVSNLKEKVNNLEDQLEKREEQIFLMKQYSKKDKSIFEKLLAERDNKAMLQKDIQKKEKLIEELRSILEMIKQ